MSKYFYYDKVEAAEEPKRKGGKQKSKKRIPTSRPAREDTASKGRAADKAGRAKKRLIVSVMNRNRSIDPDAYGLQSIYACITH